MKGFFTSILGWIVIVVIAGIVVAFIAWSRAPDVLANTLSKKLRVAVEIDDLGLSWSKITVDNLEIGNVKGSILPKAFSADVIGVATPLNRYLDKKIVIDEITIDNIYLGLEFESARGTQGNWTVIMGNLQQAEGPHPKHVDRSVFIKRLVLNNISTDLVYVQDNSRIRKLPLIKQIVLTDINSDEGFPMDQLMNSVLGQMLKSVFIQQNLQNMLDSLIQQQVPFGQYLDTWKGVFGK